MKRIAILGSTGSVGVNACRVAAALPDRIEVTALAAGRYLPLSLCLFHCVNCFCRGN